MKFTATLVDVSCRVCLLNAAINLCLMLEDTHNIYPKQYQWKWLKCLMLKWKKKIFMQLLKSFFSVKIKKKIHELSFNIMHAIAR